LKGGRPNKNLESFLNNDRKVLSFNILWEDRSYDGGDKFFVFNYYLSDGCVEVKEIITQNSGYYPFPMLLKKQKLSKAPILTHCPGMNLKPEEFYGPKDLICGQKVQIYGRECLIYDCDDFTKAWYANMMGLTQAPIKLAVPTPVMPQAEIPPYNGYGNAEDSLGSVYSLRPQPPKVDMKKMFKQDMHVLRFDARLVSTEPDDETRNFIVSFYCGDDTLQVYEICDKNSGRLGGRFMERKKQINQATGVYYCESDFLLGRIVSLGGFEFMLMSADEYTEKYMEDNDGAFPEASIAAVLQKIKDGAKGKSSLQDYAIELMKTLDKNNDGFVSLTEFCDGLAMLGINTSRAENHALLRRFDTNGDGKVSMEEFYNTLAASF
jgi:Ca2+-binding EF-hand superfamily protein